MITEMRAPLRKWGLHFAEDPTLPAADAQIFWSAEADPSILSVIAEPAASNCADRFEIDGISQHTTILTCIGTSEQLSISDGSRRIRLAVTEGTLLRGPVKLRYQLVGLAELEPKLLTLRRLVALLRLGRFSRELDPPDRRAARWLATLRAYDLAEAGASQREIAGALFGPSRGSEWRGDFESDRVRVQRLVRKGRALVNGGYLDLLRS